MHHHDRCAWLPSIGQRQRASERLSGAACSFGHHAACMHAMQCNVGGSCPPSMRADQQALSPLHRVSDASSHSHPYPSGLKRPSMLRRGPPRPQPRPIPRPHTSIPSHPRMDPSVQHHVVLDPCMHRPASAATCMHAASASLLRRRALCSDARVGRQVDAHARKWLIGSAAAGGMEWPLSRTINERNACPCSSSMKSMA